jgi:hypothetical protein
VNREHLQTRWLSETTHTGLLVAVVGALDNEDRPVLRRMLHHSATPLAVALDVDAWVRHSNGTEEVGTATWLTGLGWRAVGARPADRLPPLWQELGRRSASFDSRAGQNSRLPVPGAPR